MSRRIEFTVPGHMLAFKRTGGGKSVGRFTPPEQANYMGAVRTICAAAMKGQPPMDGPISVIMEVAYLYPASWSAQKKSETFFKTSAPDIDNLAKLLKDALNKIAYRDDAQISVLNAIKRYDATAFLHVTIEELR